MQKEFRAKEYINSFIKISIGYYVGTKFLTLNHWFFLCFIYFITFIGIKYFFFPLKDYYVKIKNEYDRKNT